MDLQHICNVMLPVVCERLNVEPNACVEVHQTDEFDETVAFVKYMQPQVYHIIIHPKQKQPVKTICHELVHVAQHLRGDEFLIELPYSEQPHEIEAYSLENELADLYFGM